MNRPQCSSYVRLLLTNLVNFFTNPLQTTNGAGRDRTDDLLLAKRIKSDNLDLNWDWPNWKDPRQTPSLSGSRYMAEGKWERPAFPRFPRQARRGVRDLLSSRPTPAVFTDEMDACSECGGIVLKEADGTYRCPTCGVTF